MVALPAAISWRRGERAGADDLAGETLLLLEDGHCLREQALEVCGLLAGQRDAPDGFAATSLETLMQMVAGGLGVTLLPRLAVAAGVIDGTGIELRPLGGAGAWRTLGLAWRANAPRDSEYRALVPLLADTCRDALAAPASPPAASIGTSPASSATRSYATF